MGMGTIDEGYVENNNGSEQLSPVIIQTKYPMMIPTPSQNHSLTAGGTTKDEVLDRLKYESSRLLTFDKWPASAKVEPRKIAKAGFFYTGQYAEAKCLWCNCVITTWDYGDQAMTRHRSASPDCPFVRDVSDNIPLLTSATSSSNIMSPQSDENTTNVDPSFDRVDFGGQNATGSNNNTSTISTNTEADTQTEHHDDTTEMYTNRLSEDTTRLHFGRSPNETRMQTSRDRASPSQRQTEGGAGDFHHPISGRPISGDPSNRPTANSLLSPDINDEVYKYESERLRTFHGWPLSFIRPADLANAGFVYTGRGDCVRCVFCREHVGDWDEDDFPHTEHRALFPHCPFVRGLDVGNVTTNAEIRERSGVVASRSSNEQSMQNGSYLRVNGDTPNRDVIYHRRRNSSNLQTRSEVRLRPHSGHISHSYQRQHSDQPQRPRSTSYDNHPLIDRNNHLEFSTRQRPTMATSGDMMEEAAGYDDVGPRPRQSGGPEKGILQLTNDQTANGKDGSNRSQGGASCQASNTPEDMGIIRHSGPANSKYSTVESRTRTFREWPPALKQQPTQLADAGFFYIGLSDQVKCFYCDGGLRNWQPEDDPWTEHARWFSECGFIRLVKGDEFISKCLNSHPPVPVQGIPVVTSRDRTRNALNEDELQKMMSSPLVRQVLAMGIESTKIKKALIQRFQETGSGFKFASEIVEATLLQNESNLLPTSTERSLNPTLATQGAPSTSAMPSSSNQPILSQQPQVPLTESHLHTTNNTQPNIMVSETTTMNPTETIFKERASSGRCGSTNMSDQSFSSATSGPERSQQMECEAGPSATQQGGVGKDDKNKDVAEPNVDLELENRRLKDQRTCKICMDREIGVVFLTCGHLISCVQCAPALKDCPLCRQPIVGTVKTYMS